MQKSMLILVAGPYRSGTNDQPELIKKNLEVLESVAFQIYEKGHMPIIGEWIALPLMTAAGSKKLGDALYEKYSYPVADRMLEHCHGVLRIPGNSKGADGDVKVAEELGLKIYHSIEELPFVEGPSKKIAR
jgi:hypothetical protein